MLTLGLGIGANAAMFGIVDRLLFRAPAYLRDPATTHRVYLSWIEPGGVPRVERNAQFARYLDFKRWTNSFSSIAAFQTRTVAVGEAEAARERPLTVASASYFDLFDARPVLGRFFTAQEDSVPVGTPVVVLSYAFWQTEFGGRSDVLGKTIRVDRGVCTIIGVAPDGFTGMSDQGAPALYMPITAYAWGFRARDYSNALSEMPVSAFLLGCREWNGRFANGVLSLIGMKLVEEGDQLRPVTFLYRLPAVVAEAEMHGFLGRGWRSGNGTRPRFFLFDIP